MYDVIIIGAGVSGAATARELSRYKVKACVIEKEEDVCCGTSKANSAIVHAGYDAAEGSLMAKLNVRGNQMMEQLSKDLDFPFKKNGSLVVCLHFISPNITSVIFTILLNVIFFVNLYKTNRFPSPLLQKTIFFEQKKLRRFSHAGVFSHLSAN